MPNSTFQIFSQLTSEQRSDLLERFPPLFDNVWCRQFSWAYNPPDDLAFPQGPATFVVNYHHIGTRHEALVGYLRTATDVIATRPDGKYLHITLSTADGVPVIAGSEIDHAQCQPIDPEIEIPVTLGKGPANRLPRERRAGA